MRWILRFTIIVVIALPVLAAKVEKRAITSRGVQRTYYLFVPDGIDPAQPASLLITLHGSGHNGSSLVDPWKGLAAKSNLIVAGPDSTDPQMWSSPQDGPQLLHDVVEELKAKYPIDGRRVYLFGHSAGAGFGLQMALIESQYFAAVAVHAGALRTDSYGLAAFATRKIPIAIFVGTRDALVPMDFVRATRDELVKNGFIADLTEIRNHTHDYYGSANSINKAAWAFLSQQALASAPSFTEYANMK